jgi:predicted O-linked N-acetylglucosamine transferase (SPINDLY family)
MNISKALNFAIEHYTSGDLQQAENICKKILKKKSNSADALHILGVIYSQRGLQNLAIQYINKALQIDPNFIDAYNNLGNIYQTMQQFDDAILYYQKALRLNPILAKTYYNLGIAFQDKGQLDEAASCYEQAIKLNFYNFGLFNNLGLIKQQQGCLNDAINYYQKALDINPNFAEALNNLGNISCIRGQYDEAIKYSQRALDINPNFVEAHNNLGNVYKAKDQYDEAIASYSKALRVNPSYIDCYYNLGRTLELQGKRQEAIAAYDMFLYFKPNNIKALLAKCMSNLLIIYDKISDIQIYRNNYNNELKEINEMISLKIPDDIDDSLEAIGGITPFYLAYQQFNDIEFQRLYGEVVHKIMTAKYPHFSNIGQEKEELTDKPIRIGFVSAYFHLHSNWKIPIKGWIENIDKNKFELYAYYTGQKKDIATDEAKQHFVRFTEDIYSFEDLCNIIRNDNLHVLIYPEIGMDAITVKLAALRLAPIQCVSWGHPQTSGLPTIDCFLSSDLMESPEADKYYTEKLVRLPNLSIYYTSLDFPSVVIKRENLGLDQKSTLYLCCQSLYKYLPQYDEIYPRIAREINDCKFLFISHKSTNITEQFVSRISKIFNSFGMDSEKHVIMLTRLDASAFSAINLLSDIYLDSIGWSGCNSTFEAIAHNLPIVTLAGEFMRGRHSSAILTMMGVTETIASSLDEYVALAVRLGLDSDWRKQISEKIAKNKHLIYSDRTCVDALEKFLENVVRE